MQRATVVQLHYVVDHQKVGKYSNCNSFGVTMDLLNSQNFKVAITQLSNVEQVCNFTM